MALRSRSAMINVKVENVWLTFSRANSQSHDASGDAKQYEGVL